MKVKLETISRMTFGLVGSGSLIHSMLSIEKFFRSYATVAYRLYMARVVVSSS